MSITAISINVFVILCLLISFIKNKKKTLASLKIVAISFIRILPTVLSIVVLIGLLLTFIPESLISNLIGDGAGIRGLFTASFLGSILHIPAILAFPLSASLIKDGAAIGAVAAFITTLTMIGFITLPLEIKEMGLKFAILRNSISFIIAIIIAIIIGVLL
ncbi:MAG: permease [Spirochaetes bacterium]|nr:permease [Spirochaetota bacterium]